MRGTNSWAILPLFTILFGATAMAGEPAARVPAHEVDPDKALAQARDLRKLCDEGNTAAMNKFGLLLFFVANGTIPLDDKHQAELQALSGGLTANDWFLKAAMSGNSQGIAFACEVAKDAREPEELRQQSREACEQARKKQGVAP